MAQEQKHSRRSNDPDATSEEAPVEAKSTDNQALDDDIDSILGEIDEVLESNAEDFVKSFIQKGGQ